MYFFSLLSTLTEKRYPTSKSTPFFIQTHQLLVTISNNKLACFSEGPVWASRYLESSYTVGAECISPIVSLTGKENPPVFCIDLTLFTYRRTGNIHTAEEDIAMPPYRVHRVMLGISHVKVFSIYSIRKKILP